MYMYVQAYCLLFNTCIYVLFNVFNKLDLTTNKLIRMNVHVFECREKALGKEEGNEWPMYKLD